MFKRKRWCISLYCITEACWNHVAAPLSIRSHPPPPCMWRGSGKLVWPVLDGWLADRLTGWLANWPAGWLAGWPGVTVGLPTKSCCFKTNQPADSGSHAACSCCESQIFSSSFFDSLCFDSSLDSKDLSLLIISIVRESANAFNVFLFFSWTDPVFHQRILWYRRGRLIEQCSLLVLFRKC